MTRARWAWPLLLALGMLMPLRVCAKNEVVTVPIILADYYAYSYYEMFKDRAYGVAWPTASADALGWGITLIARKYSGLFLVNLAGLAKTVYPIARLTDGDVDCMIRRRAWTAVGTHVGTLFLLKFLGKPALSVQSYAPGNNGNGIRLAARF